MQVKDVVALCDDFRLKAEDSAPSIRFSKPWQPKNRQNEPIPQEASKGIYLFAAHAPNEPNVDACDSRCEVLYIGMSSDSVGTRIWRHLGRVYDPMTGKVFDPPFKDHNWTTRPNIPANILSMIATGHAVVFTVSVEPLGGSPGWAFVLEKFLLVHCYLQDQRIPILNASM